MKPREDVGKRFLQRKRHGHTADTCRCEDRGDGDAIVLEDDEEPHGVDDTDEDAVEQRCLREIFARALKVHGDHAVNRACKDARDGEDVARKEKVGEQLCHRRGDLYRIDRPVESDDEAEKDGNALHGANEDIFPCTLLHREMMTDVTADEPIGDDARREGGEDNAGRDQEQVDEVVGTERVREYGQGDSPFKNYFRAP